MGIKAYPKERQNGNKPLGLLQDSRIHNVAGFAHLQSLEPNTNARSAPRDGQRPPNVTVGVGCKNGARLCGRSQIKRYTQRANRRTAEASQTVGKPSWR